MVCELARSLPRCIRTDAFHAVLLRHRWSRRVDSGTAPGNTHWTGDGTRRIATEGMNKIMSRECDNARRCGTLGLYEDRLIGTQPT